MTPIPIDRAASAFEAVRGVALDRDLASLRRSLFLSCVRYAELRARWALASRDERLAMNEERTRAHDRVIGACDALARNMARAGLDAGWRKGLGEDRKQIGDFACYVHYALALGAR